MGELQLLLERREKTSALSLVAVREDGNTGTGYRAEDRKVHKRLVLKREDGKARKFPKESFYRKPKVLIFNLETHSAVPGKAQQTLD